MGPQQTHCIVLTPEADFDRLNAVVRGSEFRLHAAKSFRAARILQAATRARIVLAAPGGDAEWLARLCTVTAYGSEASWVAVLPQSDSGRWIAALKAGAGDVLAGPFDSAKALDVLRRTHQAWSVREQSPAPWFRLGSVLLLFDR